jgi:hypothetical protein
LLLDLCFPQTGKLFHQFETKRIPLHKVRRPGSTGRKITCIVVAVEGTAVAERTGVTGFSAFIVKSGTISSTMKEIS